MHKRNVLALFFLLFLFHPLLYAQVLKGYIVDEKGNDIPYATLYVREIKQGVTSNENGHFELKLPAGTYTCLFRSLGYEMVTETVSLTAQTPALHVILPEKAYELQTVRLSASGEDPAYSIMRKAISMAPHYRQIVQEYIADVYIKGSFKVGSIKGIAGLALDRKTKKALSNSSGLVESVNEIHFTAPDNFEHRIKSAQQAMTFDLKDIGFSSDNIDVGMMVMNIYNPNMKILSSRAFSDYKFVYQGDFEEDDRLINKIKVIPRYKRDDLFHGYIYIVENQWNVYSFDLTAKYMGFNVRLEQSYGEVTDHIYLPVASTAKLDGKALGVQVTGTYSNSIKYTLVQPNEKLMNITRKPAGSLAQENVEAPKKEDTKRTKLEKELTQLINKEEPSTRDMRKAAKMQQELNEMADEEERKERGEKKTLEISGDNYKMTRDSSARRRDTTYWNEIRPIPLVTEEAVTLKKQDSIQRVRAGLPADTTKKAKRDYTWNLISDLILDGRTFRIDSSLSVRYGGLLDLSTFDFNTVDGFLYGQSVGLTKRFAKDRRLYLNASAAYAFSRKAVLWKASIQHNYWPERRARWVLEAAHQTVDFAGERGIGRVNGYASLLFRVNYAAFYDSRYIKLSNTIDIANGLTADMKITYQDNKQETNHSDFSVFYAKKRDYRPNIPRNEQVETVPELIGDNRNFLTDIAISYTPQYYYRMFGNRKYMIRSDYPTFRIQWQRGWNNIFNSTSKFDFIRFTIAQNIKIHDEAGFNYLMETGRFLNREHISFTDFKHFYTNEPVFSFYPITRPYQLLPSYTYSTNDWYVAAHAEYKSLYMALKYIPLFANLLMNERLSVSYLLTPQLRHYTEWGYALTDIYFFGEVGVFVGFEGAKYRSWGVRLAINIDNLK